MVTTQADVFSRVKSGTSLAHQYVAGPHRLTRVALDTQALGL
jgi:hypothetical protein